MPPLRRTFSSSPYPLRDPDLMLKNNVKASVNKLVFWVCFFFLTRINYLNYFTARERDR